VFAFVFACLFLRERVKEREREREGERFKMAANIFLILLRQLITEKGKGEIERLKEQVRE
jgi:hypothetical protein